MKYSANLVGGRQLPQLVSLFFNLFCSLEALLEALANPKDGGEVARGLDVFNQPLEEGVALGIFGDQLKLMGRLQHTYILFSS